MYRTLFASLLTLALAACAQDVATWPAPEPAELSVQANRLERQQADIEDAIAGLFYLSESDYPWTYNPVPKPSLSEWLASWEGSTLEQRRGFRAFFDQLTDPNATGDDAKRYRRLEQVLRRHLNHLTVYWLIDPADPVRVRVVILGTNRFGVFALSTISIET